MDPQKLAELAADYHEKVQAHVDVSREARDLEDRAARAWDDVNAAAKAATDALQAMATYAETNPPAGGDPR